MQTQKHSSSSIKNISILFLDNDHEHIIDLQKNIIPLETIEVDEIKPNPFATKPFPKRSYTDYFAKKRNTYAILSRRAGEEPYIPTNGITKANIKSIDNWLLHSSNVKTKIVLFDWDRTISVVEGFYPSPRLTEFLQHTMEYLLGGEDRIKMLQSLFKKLVENKVHIFVVTNNSAALTARKLFLTMIKYLNPSFVDDNLICSAKEKSKSVALMKSKAFTELYGKEKLFLTKKPKSLFTRKNLLYAAATTAATMGTALAVRYTHKK
jgi:hypothetical protein